MTSARHVDTAAAIAEAGEPATRKVESPPKFPSPGEPPMEHRRRRMLLLLLLNVVAVGAIVVYFSSQGDAPGTAERPTAEVVDGTSSTDLESVSTTTRAETDTASPSGSDTTTFAVSDNRPTPPRASDTDDVDVVVSEGEPTAETAAPDVTSAGGTVAPTTAAPTTAAPTTAAPTTAPPTTPATVTVPSVIGVTHSQAVSTLRGAGLAVLDCGGTCSSTVISQSPGAGANVATGSIVTLSAPAGQVSVPAVTGLTGAAAVAQLTGAGLSSSCGERCTDIVTGTIPGQGTLVDAGTFVSLRY